MKLINLLCLALMLVACKSVEHNTSYSPSFTESKKTTHTISKEQQYTFGYLEVLENRAKPNGPRIKLPVYIFKSRNTDPQLDPIIYTVGGPGSTTMPSAQYMKYYMYLDDRDFILIEQRGTAFAQPSLDCPEWSQAVYTSNLNTDKNEKQNELLENAAIKCKKRLTQQGIDLNSYTTTDIAADINDLVNVLKIETYNLLTISYSTKIAQVLMRDYPERIRSVVMDSPLPLQVNYDEESVGNLLESLYAILSDCASNAECDSTYPNLKQRFYKFLTATTQNPLALNIQHPTTKKEVLFYLRGKDIINLFTSASTAEVPHIPYEIEKILNGDLSTLETQLLQLFQKPGPGSGIGMRLSVWCAEEYPFSSQKRIQDETTKYPEVLGLSPVVFEDEICKIWEVKKVAPIENQPIQSNIPVLVINGEYDNETPVKWGALMTKHLRNSYHLIFKGWKHTPTTNWSNPCAMEAANDFFNDPNTLPKPDCLEAIKTPKFTLKKN
ncbi:TAP-like protein [Aquimarina brevivitae]|uniref:TAP-like protein n=2 Tax=Aquimarina brevivitae TaxID=323412 RepID=A0A4Q7P0Z0_9FLAO|nr:TAP-like protein [Aquimarina brevivitae]